MSDSFLSRVPALQAEVRRWVENWPAKTREALSKRVFHSNLDTVYPALLELYVHEILRNRFIEVVYEPTLPNSTHKPEFVARDTSRSIIVECKVVFDKKAVRVSSEERHRLVGFLNNLPIEYVILVHLQGILTSQMTRKVKAFLKTELPKLATPVELGHKLVFKDPKTGTEINFTIMKPKEQGENTVVGLLEIGDVTTHERIKAAIDEKATKYGNQDKPFLVVVWPKTEGPLFRESILSGVFGDLAINLGTRQVTRTRHGAVTRVSSGGQPINTRVSAVGIYDLHCPSKDDYEHRFAIFHNPYAAYPLDPAAFSDVPQHVVQTSNEDSITLDWYGGRRPDWWD